MKLSFNVSIILFHSWNQRYVPKVVIMESVINQTNALVMPDGSVPPAT